MSTVFLKILNISLVAGWFILAVVVFRLLLKKAPKWISCLLWAMVAIRLILPFSIESVLSLIPSSEVVPVDIAENPTPAIDSGIRIVNETVNPIVTDTFAPAIGDSANPLQVIIAIAAVVWLIGIVAMLSYALISLLLLKRKVRESVPFSDRRKTAVNGVRVCDEIRSPFILGIFKPYIYIPSALDEETEKYVIAHEKAHLKRLDHWWKPLGFLLLSVYWFHPLCWVAYILLCRDIEAACDEKVIKNKDKIYMAGYSQALLDCSAQRKRISACPLAFGETNVKSRIKGILNYKKPAFWVIVVAVVACVAVSVGFMTNPKKEIEKEETSEMSSETEVPSETSSETNALEKIRPKVNLSGSEGADLTELLYADKDRIIFSGYYGLFVYSKELRTITNAIDLESIGCNCTQGDNCCEKFVSADGRIVYLHPVSSTDMYVYDIPSDRLSKEKYNPEGLQLHTLQRNEEGEIFDVWSGEDRLMETHLRHGSCIGELGYIEYGVSSSDKAIPYYPLFSPEGFSGAVDFTPADVHDIVSADIFVAGELSHMPGVFELPEGGSRRLHCEDPKVLKELEKLLSEAKSENVPTGCPFYTALYLTRSDGTIGTVFPATDSCNTFRSGLKCYKMSDGSNEKLWNLINGFPEDGTNNKAEQENAGEKQQPEVTVSDTILSDWITAIELPSGYSFSQYIDNRGYQGCFLILPRLYERDEESGIPIKWQYTGMLSRLSADNPQFNITYKNGIPNLSGVPIDNHTAAEYIDVIGLERSNMQWPAIMLEESHELYTHPEVEQMKNDGIDIESMDLMSDYWYFWFVKEGKEYYYVLSLSKNMFTKDEAIRIAKTVEIKE